MAEEAREKLNRLEQFIADVETDFDDICNRINNLSRKFSENKYDAKKSREGFLTYNLERYLKPLKLGKNKVFKLLNEDLARWVFNLETVIDSSEMSSPKELD